ncbi:MAG: metallophosphoesterase [Bacilli bacterium]|nr:metallophosphoesterase [Bacilli bacterium]
MKRILKWLFTIMVIIILIIIYARFIGTMGFVTKEYTLNDKNIPNGFDGIKIVHFSDLHYNRAITLSKVKSVIKEINLINPDIVVFTGDLTDKDVTLTEDDYSDLIKVLSVINAKYGKYAILGNHDYAHEEDEIIKVYNKSGFKYLENSYDIIYNKNNESIFIGGIGSVSYNKDNLDKTFEDIKDNNDLDYKIILVHEPDISDNITKDYEVNLILAGHSHNGQIRLPIIGALYTPPHSKKYYNNYYNLDGTNLYISSGIGVSSINYRLFNKPSINFYRINKETSN